MAEGKERERNSYWQHACRDIAYSTGALSFFLSFFSHMNTHTNKVIEGGMNGLLRAMSLLSYLNGEIASKYQSRLDA